MFHFILFFMLTQATGQDSTFEVRQVTTELVYLSTSGEVLPYVGAYLTIRQGETVTATLEVVSVSTRFISCRVLSSTKAVAVGDHALYTAAKADQPAGQAEKPGPVTQAPTSAAPAVVKHRASAKKRPLRGSIALQLHQYDASNSDRSFTQPTLRLNLRAEELAGGYVGFQLRTRSRYTDTQRTRDSGNDFNNRLYKADIRIGRDESVFQYHVGRLISNIFSGVGYLDGAQGRARLSEHTQIGLFAGVQPNWQRPDGSESIDKYGAFFNFKKSVGSNYLNSTVAVAGEYQGGEVNREFVLFNNNYQTGPFSLYQSAEVDINRGWRSERASESLALSNLYLQGSYRMSDRLSWHLGYDNREVYYTYDLRNRDEAYFDNLARQGYRISVNARLFEQLRVNAGAGVQSRDNQDDTDSWYVNVYQPNLFPGGWSLRARVNGFTNPYSEGFSPSLQMGKRWRAGHQVWIGYSTYNYDYVQTGEQRKNGYLRLEGYLSLGKRWFLNSQLDLNSGDDGDGQHIYLDIGLHL